MADQGEKANRPANPVEISVFDTRVAEHGAQFGLWRDSIGVLFDIEAGEDAGRFGYCARLDSAMAGEAMVTRVRAGAQTFARSSLRAYRDGIEGVMFQVFTHGHVRRSDEAAPVADEGALVGFDLTRDMETINTGFDLVSIIFPREALESRLGDVADLHLGAIGPDCGLSRLTAEFLVSLQRSLPMMDTGEAEAASNAAADLIAECYRGQNRRSGSPDSHRIAVVTRAKAFVRARIGAGEPVDVPTLARALDCSRATLYRAFEPIGGVAAYIRSERLRACLSDMARLARGDMALTLGELAMRRGFESDAQFSRAFKAEFGMTPSDAKRALAANTGAGGISLAGGADRRYELWLRAIGAA
ncbi:MAG: hypothetical protein CMF74_02400 [Maricaulis sp.]|nr:hypothetical protein [Maricaulis sp.]HAQ35711.1 hypothetical protein [Alphaproteobacteria bacterium]